MHSIIVLALLASAAEADLKRIKKEMLQARQACGSDMACQQQVMTDGLARLKAAQQGLLDERADARAATNSAANAERDRHGGKSGGPDGQYLGFPDWAAVQAALKGKHCLHDVWDKRLRREPPVPQTSRTAKTAPPHCRFIDVHGSDRYCALNRVAIAWNMTRHWSDRYWRADDSGRHMASMHEGTCFGKMRKAFKASKDVGFRLAILDFVGEAKVAESQDVKPFLEQALKAEPKGPVRDRLEWLAQE